jgi:hypothetical protein
VFQPTDELQMRLSVAEWNLIMGILGKQQYETVAPLIAKINEQAAQQHQGPELTTMPAAPPRAVS